MTEELIQKSPLELRNMLQDMVKKELLGPAGGEEEEITERSVRGRYILGLLAPKGQTLIADEQDNLAVDGKDTLEEGKPDAAPVAAISLLPSSLGLTFSVEKTAKVIQIQARWGMYSRTESDSLTKDTGAPERVWKRAQIDIVSQPIPLKHGKFGPWVPYEDYPDVLVKGLIREYEDAWTITLYLINAQQEPKTKKDEAWVFQPELIVRHPESKAIFIKRQLPEKFHTQHLEDRRMEMNYRRHLEFVVGHGVGTHTTLAPGRWDRAVQIETDVLPSQEVLRMEAPAMEDIPDIVFYNLLKRAVHLGFVDSAHNIGSESFGHLCSNTTPRPSPP